MSIKVIAPLSPAGDFPLADAQNISFNPNNEPTPNTVEAALMTLQREVGGEGGSTPESLTVKLNRTLDKVDLIIKGLGYEGYEYDNISANEDVVSRINSLALSLGAIMRQLDGDEVEAGGIRETINAIYNQLADAEYGLSVKINDLITAHADDKVAYETLTAQIGSACTQLNAATASFLSSADALESVFNSLKTELLTDLGTFRTDTSAKINNLQSSIEDRFDTLSTTTGTNFANLQLSIEDRFGTLSTTTGTNFASLSTTIEGKVDTLSESLNSNATLLSSNVVKAVTDMQVDLNNNYQGFSATLQGQYDTLDSTLTTKYDTLSGQYTNMQNDMSAKYEALAEDCERLTTEVTSRYESLENNLNTNFGNLTAGVAEAASEAILGDVQNELKTSLSTEVSNTMSGLMASILSLRSHINTISPPTLSAEHNGDSVYELTAKPALTITASVNRPLESPLMLTINGKNSTDNPTEVTPVPDQKRSWSTSWYPEYSSGKLPFRVQTKARIVNQNDKELIYAEETLTCTFGTYVYHWVGSDTFDTTNSRLSSGHPGNTTFTCTGSQYCYYAAPEDYGTPTFTVSGTSGGFSKYKTEEYNEISYNIYRSNNQLNSITVNIK